MQGRDSEPFYGEAKEGDSGRSGVQSKGLPPGRDLALVPLDLGLGLFSIQE